MAIKEPCLCGDPECPNCFPVYEDPDVDEDETRQREVDELESL